MSNNPKEELKAATELQAGKVCSNWWCSKNVAGSYADYCYGCLQQRKNLGVMHPPQPTRHTGKARTVSYKVYAPFFEPAERVMLRYRDNPGIKAAAEYLQMWMEDAVLAPDGTQPGQKFRYYVHARAWMARLHAEEADPYEMLTHLLAAWLYGRHHKELYDSAWQLRPLLGSTLLRSIPYNDKSKGHKKLPKSAINEAGNRIVKDLLGWLVRMESAVQAMDKHDKHLQVLMRSDFQPDLSNTLSAINKIPALREVIQEGRLVTDDKGNVVIKDKKEEAT